MTIAQDNFTENFEFQGIFARFLTFLDTKVSTKQKKLKTEIKNSSNQRMIAYLTSNRNRFSEWAVGFRYRISSFRGLKKALKLARGLIFGGFFNPWNEEILIPESPFGNPIFQKELLYFVN